MRRKTLLRLVFQCSGEAATLLNFARSYVRFYSGSNVFFGEKKKTRLGVKKNPAN